MSFAFVQSSVVFDFPLPFQITERFSFARANSDEVIIIRKQLAMIRAFFPGLIMPYDVDQQTVTDDEKNVHRSYVPIPENDCRYWIVSFDETNRDLQELEFALTLLQKEIRLGFVIFNFGDVRGVGGQPAFAFQFFNDFQTCHERPVKIGANDLADVTRLFDLIISARTRKLFIFEALLSFFNLNALAVNSKQQVLGYFSVLESLITHNPSNKEIGGSLTHQLKTKLCLLEKMFCRQLEFSAFEQPGKLDIVNWKQAIWGGLYSYRSSIAHGNRYKFEKDFQILKSHQVALMFLREVTKLVLILALEKPEFIDDLKAV